MEHAADVLKTVGLPSIIAYLLVVATNFFAPKAWERYSAYAKARDEFIKGTTAQVVNLAGTHYWALAQAAGTTGELLAEHLRNMQAQLMLNYASRGRPQEQAAEDLRARIDSVCRDNAALSFPSLVRLIVLFHRFQFSGSQTYLLPHFAAGVGLARLYNQFIAALPEESFASKIRQAIEKHLAEEDKWQSGAAPPGIDGSFLVDETRLDDLKLKETREMYARWLRDNVVNVADASDALRTYAELLSFELAELNRVFFRDRGRSERTTGEFGIYAVLGASWSGTLSEGSLLTLQRAGAESQFYRPLGSLSPGLPTAAAPMKTAPASAAPGAGPTPTPPVPAPAPAPTITPQPTPQPSGNPTNPVT
jgi:hypothetical protein